jgi:ribosomal protein S27AE
MRQLVEYSKRSIIGGVYMEKPVWMSDKKCPKCGATLLTNGKDYWCSNIGELKKGIRICDYGLIKQF